MTDSEPDGRVHNSPLRKKFAKRTRQQIALTSGVTPKELLKSPSQKKSERGKMKELKRAGVSASYVKPPYDCNCCPKEPCGQTMATCGVVGTTLQCSKCGGKYIRRSYPEQVVYLCPFCRSRST